MASPCPSVVWSFFGWLTCWSPCHRRPRCARRDDAPTAPPPRSAHRQGSTPAAHRPPAPPVRCPNPGPATGADPHPGHRRAPCGRSGHTAAEHRFVAAPAPPPARRRQPRPRRTLSSITVRLSTPAAHAITSHCARRCPLLWFLTLDKPETLSDNDCAYSDQKPTHGTVRRAQFGEESRLVVRLGDEVDCFGAAEFLGHRAAAASSMIARMAFSAATSSCSRIARATSSCNAIASVFGRSGIAP